MSFSESVKKEAKKKAAYHCVMCSQYEVFLEVHHLQKEADGGPDDLDNAIALCPNCHTKYGNNPDLRKFLKEKRDFWYEECEARKKNNDPLFDTEALERVTEKITKAMISREDQRFAELKTDIKNYVVQVVRSHKGLSPERKNDIQRVSEGFIDIMSPSTVSVVTQAVMSALSTMTEQYDPGFAKEGFKLSPIKVDLI